MEGERESKQGFLRKLKLLFKKTSHEKFEALQKSVSVLHQSSHSIINFYETCLCVCNMKKNLMKAKQNC